MCTINKSAHTKKVWKLFEQTLYIYIYEKICKIRLACFIIGLASSEYQNKSILKEENCDNLFTSEWFITFKKLYSSILFYSIFVVVYVFWYSMFCEY